MRQLLQHILLLGREILSLLEAVKHLKLLLGEVEWRSLLLLLRNRILARLEPLRWYCIVRTLDGIRRWRSWISLLKTEMKKKKLVEDFHKSTCSTSLTGKVEIYREFHVNFIELYVFNVRMQ
jgi:hypothetical protein